MNEYKVSSLSDNATIIAIDGDDACRIFRDSHNLSPTDVIYVKLLRENVSATKDQERKALERIRAILIPFDLDSGFRIAFEGCLEDAKDNIENDFALSMKARWESAEIKLRKEMEGHKETKEELDRCRQALRETESNIERMSYQLKEAKTCCIGREDAENITEAIEIINEKLAALETEVSETAAQIVETATYPDNTDFKDAVRHHRAAKKDMDHCVDLIQHLDGLQARLN